MAEMMRNGDQDLEAENEQKTWKKVENENEKRWIDWEKNEEGGKKVNKMEKYEKMKKIYR